MVSDCSCIRPHCISSGKHGAAPDSVQRCRLVQDSEMGGWFPLVSARRRLWFHGWHTTHGGIHLFQTLLTMYMNTHFRFGCRRCIDHCQCIMDHGPWTMNLHRKSWIHLSEVSKPWGLRSFAIGTTSPFECPGMLKHRFVQVRLSVAVPQCFPSPC